MRILKLTVLIGVDRIIIPYKGLAEGNYDYAFTITDKFFGKLEYSEFEDGNIHVSINLNKKTYLLEIQMELIGQVKVTCDRCLDLFYMPVNYQGNLIVKFSEETDETDDDLIVISPNENNLDLSHYIYESIYLNLPVQKIHPDDENGNSTCNEKMLKLVKNLTKKIVSKNKITDPRWDALKNIKNNI